LIAAMIGFHTAMPFVMPPRFGPSWARRRFHSGERFAIRSTYARRSEPAQNDLVPSPVRMAT